MSRRRIGVIATVLVGLVLVTTSCASSGGSSSSYYRRGGYIHADSFPGPYGRGGGYYGRPYGY